MQKLQLLLFGTFKRTEEVVLEVELRLGLFALQRELAGGLHLGLGCGCQDHIIGVLLRQPLGLDNLPSDEILEMYGQMAAQERFACGNRQ